MEYVEPIKSKEHIAAMKSALKHGYGVKQGSLRDWTLFILGINSGLRISDLLRLTVEDVVNRDRITIKEQKSARVAKDGKPAKAGKTKDFPLSSNCVDAINEYLSTTKLSSGSLFPSRKLGEHGISQPISRQQAYDIINGAALHTKIITKKNSMKIGCHSLRKTFGYHAYNSGVPIETIQKLMNHSSSSTTLAYIGITRQSMDDVYTGLNL